MQNLTRPFAVLTIAFLLPSLAVAGGVVYEDDFERADGPVDGWTVTSGTWEIIDGALVTTATGAESWAWAGDPNVLVEGDLTAEFSVDFGTAPGDVVGNHGGVMVYASQPGFRGDGSINGYTVDWIDRANDRGMRLIRWDNGAPNILVASTPEVLDRPVTWRIEVEGDAIRVFGDDVQVIEVFDATYREGRFGAWAYLNGTQLIVDNVFIEYTPQLVDACFTSSAVAGGAPLTVDFDAACSVALAEIASYEWDFGDGMTGDGAQVSHTFEFPDPYVVTLTVTDIDGNSATAEQSIAVFPGGGDFEDDFARADGPVDGWTVFTGDWQIIDETMIGTSAGGEIWAWAGDPAVATPAVFTLEFDLSFLAVPADAVGRHGGVMICASAPTDRSGAQGNNGYEIDWIDRVDDHGLRVIRVTNGVHALVGQGAQALADPPSAWRIVVGPATIEIWGDDVLLVSVDDATHRGGLFGTWAWANNQQVAYDNFRVSSPELIPCFTSSPASPLAAGVDVTFDSGCTVASGQLTVIDWDFGDGSTASGAVVEHTFAAPGVYEVTLTVETSTGARDSSARTITAFEVLESFADDFERDDGPPDGWTVVRGAWRLEGEALRVEAAIAPEAWIFAGVPPARFEGVESIRFRFEFLVTPFDAVGRHAGVFFFAQNSLPRFSGNSGYTIDWIDRIADQGYRVSVWNNGVETPLLAGTGDLDPGVEWEIEIDGETIRLIVDGEPKAEVVDSTWRAGGVGFWSYFNGQDILIDDVEIGAGGIVDPPRTRFIRGDVDAAGSLQLTDGVAIFNFLFLGGTTPTCMEAADADNDGIVNLTDGIRILNFLFLGGPPPVEPETCGVDTDPIGSPRDIGCESFRSC